MSVSRAGDVNRDGFDDVLVGDRHASVSSNDAAGGRFDRIFVYDKVTGEELSTLDGAWLITYCGTGVLGLFTRYGLLTWPIWRAFRLVRRVPNKSDQMLLAGVGVTTAMVAVDLLPNGM